MSAPVDGFADERAESPPGFPPETFRANLYVHHPDGHTEWYALLPAGFEDGRALRVGRDERCAITIDDDAVSSRHGKLTARGDRLYYTDVHSTNGTAIDDVFVEPGEPTPLDDGAVITIGNVQVRFFYSHRRSPYRLVLDFDDGPLDGTRTVSDSASVTVGGSACDVALAGEGVAEHHLRLDVYGPRQIYGVPLDDRHATKLVGVPLPGVCALVPGAQLEVGPHRFAVSVRELAVEPPPPEALAAPPRVDAAHLEARRQGHDPGAFDARTIMDLSPLGAMVAKVLAGEMPPPPSAVRPSARVATDPGLRDDPRETGRLAALELARRTGPLPGRVVTPSWHRWATLLLVLVATVAVVGLIPVPQTFTVTATVDAGPEVVVRAPVGGRLIERLVEPQSMVQAGQTLARVTDGAVEAELDRLSARIGELEALASDRRVDRRALKAARDEVAETGARLEQALARLAQGEIGLDALMAVRNRHHERRGRLAALEARRAGGEAARPDAEDLGRLVQRRQSLTARLAVNLDAAARGRVLDGPAVADGDPVVAGAPLYRLATLDPVRLRIAADDPALASALRATDGRARTAGDAPTALRFVPDAGGYGATVADPDGRLTPGSTVEVTVEGPPLGALTWLGRRIGGS